ncbi:MAG: hypothetical protein KDA87_05025 [Planctomycetales bacterium]|nr:hypothetical protein [Planctomycetales bacterium]
MNYGNRQRSTITGMTLVEVTLALGVMSLMFVSVTSIFQFSHRQWQAANTGNAYHHAVLDQMADQIQDADQVLALSSDALTVAMNGGGLRRWERRNSSIYYWENGKQQWTVEDVTPFRFKGYLQNGVTLASRLQDIRVIKLLPDDTSLLGRTIRIDTHPANLVSQE